MNAIIIGPNSYPAYSEAISLLRIKVFVEEQGVPADLEMDGRDKDCAHAIMFENACAIATGRIQADGHIGRVAVAKEHRGKGLGRTVMGALIGHAREQGYDKVWLSAQCHAASFYKSLGFVPCGDVYKEANMDHIKMEMRLQRHCS